MLSVIRLARHSAVLSTVVGSLGFLVQGLGAANRSVPKVDREAPRNIIFVLADDHRFDAVGFAGHPFLNTPNLDRMAKGGAWFPNAFVTTSLLLPKPCQYYDGSICSQS